MNVVDTPVTLSPLLSQCLALLRLVHLGLAFLDDFSYLVVKCSNVKQRLHVWGQSCGLVDTTSLNGVFTNEDERRIIRNTLDQIQSLLRKVGAILQRYEPVAAGSGLEITTQLSKLQVAGPGSPSLKPARHLRSYSFLDGLLRKQSHVLLRMKWAAADRARFFTLIENTGYLVEDLEKITQHRNIYLSQRAIIRDELRNMERHEPREFRRLAYTEPEDEIEEVDAIGTCDWPDWNDPCSGSSPTGESVEGSITTEHEHPAASPATVPMLPSGAFIHSLQASSGSINEYLSSVLQGAQETLEICEMLLAAEYTHLRSRFGGTSEPVNHVRHNDHPVRDKASVKALQHFHSLGALSAAGKGLASELHRVSKVLHDLQSGLLSQPDVIPAATYIIFAWVLSLRIITNAWRWSYLEKGRKVRDEERKCVEFVATMTNDLNITTEGLRTTFVYRAAR